MSTSSFEKKIARLHVMLWSLTLAIALILAWILLAPNTHGTLRAEAFELVDADGHVVAVLETSEGQPRLALQDGAGVDRVRLFHDGSGSGLYIADTKGTTRIGVAQFAHGGGGVALHGEDSKGALVMYFKESGSVQFYDRSGQVIRELSAADLRNSP